MTKPVFSTDPPARRQRGDALIEAMLGVLLMTIVGLGLSYAAARALNSQRYQSTQNLAIAQMRNVLTTRGLADLCAGTSLASVSVNASVVTLPAPTCAQATVSVGVAGSTALNVTLPAGVFTSLRFSTPSNNETTGLFGGDGVLTFSQ
ncbi:hypothetical protein BH10PSE16_BH10PSE16_22960 [soil metagenome]